MAVLEHLLRIKGLDAAAAGLADLGDSAKKAGKELSGSLSDGVDAVGSKAGKLGQGLGVLSPTMGAMGMAAADLADGVMALATPTGLATAAVIGLGAAALGSVAAVATMGASLVAATLAADDALTSLEGFRLIGSDIYPAVPAATLTSIKEANAAVDALASVFSLIVVAVASDVAPAFAKAGKAAVGLGLEIVGVVRAIVDSQSLLQTLAQSIGMALSEPLMMVLRPLAMVQDGYAALADALGQEVHPAMRNNVERLEAMRKAMIDGAAQALDLSVVNGDLGRLYDSLAESGNDFVQSQMQATAAMENSTSAADAQAEALDKLRKSWEDYSAAREYDMSLGEKEAAQMDATRALMEKQAAAVGGSFNIGEAIGGAASAQAAPSTAGQTLGMLGNAAGALQGGAGGIGGALSSMGASAGMAAAGPIVAAIMQIVQLVTSIVPEDGQEGLLDQLHGTVMEFMGDIGELPQVLADFMSDTIREGIPAMMQIIPELVEGLISAIPQLIMATIEQFPLMIGGLVQMLIVGIPKAILQGIGALFSADLWKGLAKSMVEAFKEIFAPIFGNKKTGEKGAFQEGGYFDGVFVGGKERQRGERSSLGSRASGDDFIPQTGLYLMHRGESVAGNGRTLPAGARSGGQPTTIVVQGSLMASMEDLAAAIRDAKRRGVSFG
jgi:hypothetical protein